jgi:CubicO group peptidase (beta-lactamase class C family)
MRYLVAFTVLALSLPLQAADFTWQPAGPASQAMSRQKLDALRDELARNATQAFLVARHDKLVYEWYSPDFGPEKMHGTASLAKAVVGGMALAIAMQDGRVKPTDLASKYIPQWRGDPRKSKITVAQLATHTSGLDDAEKGNTPHEKLTGWKQEFWKRGPRDPFTVSRDDVPVLFEPGGRVSYSNPGMAMLAYAVTAALPPGGPKDVRALLRERVYGPIGIGPKQWSVGYGTTYHAGGLDLVADWGGAAFTARAAARIGRLMLREGDWDGRRILDRDIVRTCVNPTGTPSAKQWEGDQSPSPGFGWWSNRDGAWPSVPRDAYLGAGAGDQLLVVIPSLDLICVRNGSRLNDIGGGRDHWKTIDQRLLAPLVAAVDDAPLKPSAAIRGVHFDPESAIVRKSYDSDNWPITWADDDNLYTAYGDGHGFEPFIKPKLSLGLARVEGGPTDFHGVNVRSESAERTGDGARGPKASGMLMVDGTLYMWVRNTANATLAWSADHGLTWTWGFKFDSSFGCPTFLNFGRNYAGAPDDYVYVYSQDGPGAYEPYDGVVLARVHRAHLKDRSAYEFFTGSDAAGSRAWSRDAAARAHVIHDPGRCDRLDVIYDPGIGRYLMAMSFGQGNGWGLLDAPHPWGPWTIAFQTRDWGLGQTHGYRLPTKWISPDGRQIWLVFSGRKENDAFCVRRMSLDLYSEPPAVR